MDITPNLSEDTQVIQRYGAGRFVVNGTNYTHSLFIGMNAIQQSSLNAASEITSEALSTYLQDEQADILLIGTGAQQYFIPPLLRQEVKKCYGIIIEAMDTGAACRTYNVLSAEDRRVVALLITV